MPRYIDADALYEQTAEWEAMALAVVEKLNSKPLGEMDVNEITEWRKWSCILNERSAFKHDVADAPTADVVERKRGKWIYIKNVCLNHSIKICSCSVCGLPSYGSMNFCSRCGADMREESDNG